jgi:MFS family permease
MLVDRGNRTRLLAVAVACWGAAMVLSGVATNFLFLLLARVALGIVVAAAGPAIASLIGDYFPERERGRIYGFVLSGELIGAGFGFVIAGQFAVLSWRAPFLVLVLPTLLAAWLVGRLPEPARGGASRIAKGQQQIGEQGDRSEDAQSSGEQADDATAPSLAQDAARSDEIEPRRSAILDRDPQDLTTWQAFRFVLRVRTNIVLIVASALGYFFFSGLRGFAVEFAKKHYSISQGVASTLTLALGVGALAGVLAGGRFADRLLRHGRIPARVEVPGVAVLAAAALFVPAIITTHLSLAIPLLVLAAGCLGAANPPLDAARLDIMVPRLWGRAEAVRSLLRNAGDAAAPLLFGVLASAVFGGSTGLEYTFLVMLIALVAAAAVTLAIGRRTYPFDVAAATESMERVPTSANR